MQISKGKIYDVIEQIETGGLTNKFIRTKLSKTKGGSTAFGPMQMTRSAFVDLKENSNLTRAERNLADKLIRQADSFNKYGNAPDKEGYDKKFDYGGTGVGLTNEEKQIYTNLANKFLDLKAKRKGIDLSESVDLNDAKKVLAAWKGKDVDDYVKKGVKLLSPTSGFPEGLESPALAKKEKEVEVEVSEAEPPKSFKQAFAEARANKDAEFTYGGDRYNTRLKGETPQQYAAFLGKDRPVQVAKKGGMVIKNYKERA
tara:strand:- start:30 stop:800 length:771 start_codon:yes stop_codon:yes gene_type:complete